MVAETAYLIGRQLGPAAKARLFRSIADGEISVEPLTGTDLAQDYRAGGPRLCEGEPGSVIRSILLRVWSPPMRG